MNQGPEKYFFKKNTFKEGRLPEEITSGFFMECKIIKKLQKYNSVFAEVIDSERGCGG